MIEGAPTIEPLRLVEETYRLPDPIPRRAQQRPDDTPARTDREPHPADAGEPTGWAARTSNQTAVSAASSAVPPSATG